MVLRIVFIVGNQHSFLTLRQTHKVLHLCVIHRVTGLDTLLQKLFELLVVHRFNLKYRRRTVVQFDYAISIPHSVTFVVSVSPLLTSHRVFLHNMDTSLSHIFDDKVFNPMSVTENSFELFVGRSVWVASMTECKHCSALMPYRRSTYIGSRLSVWLIVIVVFDFLCDVHDKNRGGTKPPLPQLKRNFVVVF